MTLSAPRRWRWVLVSLVGIVLLILAAAWLAGRDGAQSYMAALRARGEKLTIAELAIPYLTNGTPRTKMLVDAVNDIVTKPAALGMVSPMELVAPGRARHLTAGAELVFSVQSVPWPELDAQLDALETSLRAIRESVQEPEPDFGVDPKLVFRLIRRPLVERRTAAQLLVLDTLRHLHAHDLDQALASLNALAKSGHVQERELLLVVQMVNTAIAGLGLMTTWEALQTPGWTEPQLALLQRDWESFDFPANLERGLVGERAMGLEYFSLIRITNASQANSMLTGGTPAPPAGPAGVSAARAAMNLFRNTVVLPAYRVFIAPGDERFFLELTQFRIEKLRELIAGKPVPEVVADMTLQNSQLESVLGSWKSIRFPTTSILTFNTRKALQTICRNETLRRLTVAALAIERHRLRHGRLPPSLDALVPEFIRTVPMDPMDGRPLRYRVLPDGSFRLWSVGEDGTEQGGESVMPKSTNDMILFGSTPDILWPSAASAEEVAAHDTALKARGKPVRRVAPPRR